MDSRTLELPVFVKKSAREFNAEFSFENIEYNGTGFPPALRLLILKRTFRNSQ